MRSVQGGEWREQLRAALFVGVLGAAVWCADSSAGWGDDAPDREVEPTPPPCRLDHPTGDGLAMVPSPLREALEAFVDAEFALDRPITPEVFATGFVEALVAGGLPTKEAVRTAAAFAAHAEYLAFVDRRRMTEALSAAHPDCPVVDGLAECKGHHGAAVPPGGVVVACNDILDEGMLFWARHDRNDPSWLPRDAFDEPIECLVSACSFNVDSPGVIGEDDTLRVRSTMELFVEQPGEKRRSLTRTSIAVTEPVAPRGDPGFTSVGIPTSGIHVPRSAFPLPDGARLIVEVRYEAVHHAPGITAEKRAAIAGTTQYQIVPRMAADGDARDPSTGVKRFEVFPLGTDGEDLARPEVVSDRAIDCFWKFVLSGKPSTKEWILKRADAERKHTSLLGRDLTSVPLIRGADGMPGELALRADRTHILLFGATWCGPCHERAPSVEKFIEAIAGRDDAPLVHRLSIDDDPDSFDAALAAYPSGICTEAFEEDFVVDAVPKYYLVREGKVVEQGGVSEEAIAAWREQYAP